ncbi:sigma factor-like helix-turn-helix DNA-binding protein [Sphingosinicella xenopeptidilytica]|uniref:Sigma factor-like helix-turn-helix DNA-binding protein n=1 Tax=Sphingosinicella xenopeptidilytica TaxID=364098 RepID=A0ABW3CAI3_SPHXN
MQQRINGATVPQEMDRLSVMRRVLEGLPETTLVVFMAHRVEGKRYAEIAREMGISEWRVERHMVKAISRIAGVGARYRTAFLALDPVSRQVLELAWEGLSHDRIALRLGLALHEVETRMSGVAVRDSQTGPFLIQGCFWGSSHGPWGLVGCGVGTDRPAAAI